MAWKQIPYYVPPPTLSGALVAEITAMVFGEAASLRPCDVIFVFGGSHPGLWENGAEAYSAGLGKEIIATGGRKPNALRPPAWQDGTRPEAEVIRRELESSPCRSSLRVCECAEDAHVQPGRASRAA